MIPARPTDRESRAQAVLDEEGLPGTVRSEGTEGEIAAIAAPATAIEALRRVAPRLRGLGYRYVALDLAAEHRTKE